VHSALKGFASKGLKVNTSTILLNNTEGTNRKIAGQLRRDMCAILLELRLNSSLNVNQNHILCLKYQLITLTIKLSSVLTSILMDIGESELSDQLSLDIELLLHLTRLIVSETKSKLSRGNRISTIYNSKRSLTTRSRGSMKNRTLERT